MTTTTTPLTRKCPTCHAPVGQPCRTYGMPFCLDRTMPTNWRTPTAV